MPHSTMPKSAGYLTVQQAADYLAVSPCTIRRRIHAGIIPAVRVGNRLRIKRAHVERPTVKVRAA